MTLPERVAVATGNPGKVREVLAILGAGRDPALAPLHAVAWSVASDWGEVAYPEEGDDYEANARAKAAAAAGQLGVWAVADDSGLEVDALDGGPGPRSARFGGPGLDDRGRVARLLESLSGVAAAERGARFVCVAAAAAPDGRQWVVRGECAGRILEAPRGGGGFGYDPVFALDDPGAPELRGRAMAELAEAEKHAVSHRGRAFRRLAGVLEQIWEGDAPTG